ncbi:MAG TPA: hypothetical protein VK644_09620 [Chitinophagaceae bacterium]|nr:hypothetical protein [Chitinophagaceae bacterium]
MSFFNLLWILVLAWIVSCGYYFWRINRISRSNGHSPFFNRNKSSNTSRAITRKLYRSMLATTIFFLIVILLAYLITVSSA